MSPAEYPQGGGSGGPETDPVFVSTGATDAEVAAIQAALVASIALKQNAATAATDAEVAAAVAALEDALADLDTDLTADIAAAIAAHAAGDATDAELAAAVAQLNTDIAAMTDSAELAAAIAAHAAGDATDAELAAAVATLQPLDADLTAIAALATTSIGRSLLAGADAAALRTIIGSPATSHTHAQADVTNLVSDLAAKVAASVLAASGVGVIVHGATADPTRGTDFEIYIFIGTVEPTTAQDNDLRVKLEEL